MHHDSDTGPVTFQPQPVPPEISRSLAAPSADLAIDQLADGYFEMDEQYRYRRVNAAGLRITGKSGEELLGKHLLEVFPDVTDAPIHETVRRVMTTGKAESVETYYAPFRRWFVNSFYRIPDGLALFTRDINDQKVLEQNLAFLADASMLLSSSLDTQETLRAVARIAVPRIGDWCAIDLLTAPGKVELLTVAHVDPVKSQWARDLRESIPVDLDRPFGLAKVLQTGEPEFYPEITDQMLVAMARDATALELARSLGCSSAMIVPLNVRDATIGAITFVATESGRHYTTADLAMAQELASRAALAIENSQLYAASQHAVALRDDFIAAASHELRTPVTSLKVYTEVLLRQAEQRGDHQALRALRAMHHQIDRLNGLIVDLLDVTRIESGTLELRQEEFDFRQLVDDVVDMMQATTQHRIEVAGPSHVMVTGDHERLGQVLTNLISNAVKYSPQSDRVIVRLISDAEAVIFEVEDFGIGIAPEHLPHLFDRFYRVSSSREKTFPGLGMGLYIVQEIVRRHGGSLDVQSVSGRGSCFRVHLPVQVQTAPAAGGNWSSRA